ncbi:MAG: acylphosphatase [Nanobdellota archaeon]
MRRYHVWIYGRVQGVNFRFSTMKEARKLGINGWVRNNEDGSVETVIEGQEENIDNMLNFLKKGPSLAKVDDIKTEKEKVQGLSGFTLQ